MSLSSCSALGYSYSESFCLKIRVYEEQDNFTANKNWIVGAFFLGIVLGAGLVLLLAKPFLNAWKKKKRQDEEELLGTAVESKIKKKISMVSEKKQELAHENKEGKGGFGASRFRRKIKDLKSGNSEGVATKGDVDPSVARGMVDVMLQATSNGAEVEMADQDMAAIVAMENSMEEEKEVLMLRILAMLMKMKVERREMTKNYHINFTRKMEEDLKDLNKMIDREKEEAEEKLRNDPKLSKDVQALETEMQKLQTDSNTKRAKLHRDFKDKIRLDLLRSSGMSEAEVNNLMAQLMNEMSAVEEKLGLEQARQRRALEQRLARRRQAMEFRESEDEEAQKSIDKRVEIYDDILSSNLPDISKLEGQRDEIKTSFENDLLEIQKYHAKELDGLMLEKSDALQNLRLTSFYNLSKNQEKEKAFLMQTADKATNIQDFVKLYHDLIVKHHMEQETLGSDLDQNEVQEMYKLKQGIAKEEAVAMDKATERQTEKLENVANVMASDADKIIRLHKAQMADYNAKRQRERQAIMVQLQEKLKQRLAAADEAEARDQKEQELLKKEQMETMARVLSTNMELDEDAKKRVLREHEQNMQALSNQLLRSKLRQQKSLEIKLNQRKARLADLRMQQKQIKESRQKEKKDLEQKLEAEIMKEEVAFEESRQEAVAELRRQLAKETEVALKLQDEEIGLLIGRLQVGQARRKAILEKQDATLKELQERLEQKITTGKALPGTMTNQIIQEHYNHVSHLNQQMQKRRAMQQKAIMEKLQFKRNELEEQIETQLEKDAQEEYTERQKKGAKTECWS